MSPGGRIKDSDIDAVRERTDIVRMISEYVPLKKSGREYRGPCPFHQEKDPSFYVNPAKGVYFCFGCKASGGVFNFVMQVEGLKFNDAVERLADSIGYQLSYETVSPDDMKRRTERDRLYTLNQTAADYFHYLLTETENGKKALSYLKGRGLEDGVIDTFHLGFAPDGWDNLSAFLAKKGYSEREMVTAGVAKERPRGKKDGRGVYDIFRSRIIFPIMDHRGRVVAFGGRRMEEKAEQGEPKYLNSPETPVYRKGRTLYGFYQTRAAIQDAAEAVVVEGYTDLLALWQAGVAPAVATLGTAMTENHFELLNRFCDRVYLAFDADRAGVDAALRPLEFWNRFKIEVMVITLPDGEDPASLVEKGGAPAFREFQDRAEPLLDFAARKKIEGCDTSTPLGRRRAMEGCVPIIAKVSSEDMRPVRNDLLRKVAGQLDMPLETVEVYMREASRLSGRPAERGAGLEVPAMWQKVEKEALRVLLHDPEALIKHQYLDSEYFSDESYKNIFEKLKEISVYDEDILRVDFNSIISRLVDGIEDERLRSRLTELLIEPPPQSNPGYEDKVLDRLSYLFFKKRMSRIEFEMTRVNKELEPKKYDALCNQLLELDQVIKEQFPYDHR
ncbi:MAG: DNA primase [Actinobacteria bacterium]|nr:DNA primase [Actinomycetota bacterium]